MYRVTVKGQYKGEVYRKPRAASPWCWQRVETRLDGSTRPRGVETFRRLADVAPWIARVCRANLAEIKLTRSQSNAE